MDWCRLDTSYYLDAAVLRAGEPAEVLFLRCIAYCAAEETRGRLPRYVLPFLTPTRTTSRLAALLEQKLLVEDGDDVLIRSWDKWQEALDKESDRRRTAREKKARQRAQDRDRPEDKSSHVPSAVQPLVAVLSPGRVPGTVPGQSRGPTRHKEVEVEVEQKSKAPPGGTADAEQHAGTVIAAYVNAALDAGKGRPAERLRGKVGKQAKAAAAEGRSWSEMIAAASRMGASGWDDLDRELQNPQRGKPVGDGRASLPDADYDDLGIFARSQP